MTHNKLTPIIFVLNNKGYNIERHLHGLDRRVVIDKAHYVTVDNSLQEVQRHCRLVRRLVLFICIFLKHSHRKWASLLTTLGDIEGKLTRSYTVRSKSELDKLLDDEEFASARKIQLVEVIMDKYDTPRALQASAELTARAAAGQL